MNKFAKPLALVALALTIAPSALFLLSSLSNGESASSVSDSMVKSLMLVGTVLWFVTAPQWLREDD